jgi:hypothetical protein
MSVVEYIEIDDQIVEDVLFRGRVESAHDLGLDFAFISLFLIDFENLAFVLLKVGLHHLFAQQLHAAIVVADHEQTRFDVILAKGALFIVFAFVLSAVKFLAFAGEFDFARTYSQLFSFGRTANLIGDDVDNYPTLNEFYNRLLNKIEKTEAKDQTAFGPALVAAIEVA